jgi:ubiquinone/menaquinone biosynthesis C-methylase UbiE
VSKTILFRVKLLATPLRIFFSLLYHQFAWTYDWVASVVSIGMWNQWIQSVIPYLTGSCILELGHGPGHLLVTLNKMSRLVIGLDRSPQMSRIARQRLDKNNFSSRLILGSAQSLPLLSNSLDHIVATFPSEYIFNPQTITEAYRVLNPGGTWIIVPYAWITGGGLIHRAAAWLFNVTGESPQHDNVTLQPLENAGFLVTTEKVQLPTSKVLIVCAQKSPN